MKLRGHRLGAGGVDGSQIATLQNKAAVKIAGLLDWAMAATQVAKPVVMISGFWRSGTTWLQECIADSIGAKTVFEPLSPANPRRNLMLKSAFPDSADAKEALIPGPMLGCSPFWKYVDDAFYGRYSSHFMLSCRRNIREGLHRHIVVKDVRLQFNLQHVHDRYALPIIHVRRDPFAVIASLIAADWQWSFERVRLADLLSPAHRLSAGEVEAFDCDATSRIAAYWAITEHFAAQSLRGKDWGCMLSYEAIRRDPQIALTHICTWLGIDQIRTADFDRPSASTHSAAHPENTRTEPELCRRLTDGQISRIREVITRIYPVSLAALS